MRICFVADGQSIHLQRIISYFVQRGHEIHLITRPADHLGAAYAESVQIHFLAGLVPKSRAVSRFFQILVWTLSGLVWFLQLRVLLKEIRPDILNCHYITVHGYLGALSRFHPFIITPWGSDVLVEAQKNSLYKMMARYTLRKADIVMCDSQTMKTYLLDLGVPPGKIRPLVLGVDTEAFTRDQPKSRTVRELRELNSPVVISTRNLRPIYNVDLLIRAAALILRRLPNAQFVIGGDGEERDQLMRKAIETGVAENILWVGWIPHEELPAYLASADVYVSTSRSDSTSLSLQEAMACELAPVVTDIPANREWVTDGENGFIVPLDDSEALADRVTTLLESEELRRKFGANCRQIIKTKAEEKTEMIKLEKLYVSVTQMTNRSSNERLEC